MEVNATDELTLFNFFQKNKPWQMFLRYHGFVTMVLTILAVAGNSLTIACIFRFSYLRCARNALVGSLSVSDLCVGLSLLVWYVYNTIAKTSRAWDPTDILSIMMVFISYAHMIVITIDRFVAITRPLRYAAIVTERTLSVMIAVAWSCPLVMILPLYIIGLRLAYSGDGYLYLDTIHWLTTVIVYCMLAVTFCILYAKILKEARSQAQKVHTLVQVCPPANDLKQKSDDNQRNKGTRMIFMIVSNCLLLTFLYILQSVMKLCGVPVDLGLSIVEYFGQQCLLANSSVNVLIYAVFNKDFRKAYKAMLRSLFCRKP
jgi:hypothetical protein